VAWAVLVAFLFAVPVSPLMGDGLRLLPRWLRAHVDLVVHCGLFFITAFLFHQAWRFSQGWKRGLVVALALTVAYGALTEATQLLMPGRTAEWRDLGANVVGAGCYGLLTWLRALVLRV
jgi:VanZ family protein